MAPTTQVPILVQAHDGAIELISARWGLIPVWWKDDKAPAMTLLRGLPREIEGEQRED